MRAIIAGLSLVLGLPSLALAASTETNKQTCILASAERLPKIAGLEITHSAAEEVKPVPKDWPSVHGPIVVDLDFKAAGLSQRWSFLCGIVHGLPPMISRVKH